MPTSTRVPGGLGWLDLGSPDMDAGGVGRLAMPLDPFGAPFAVITSATA
ncbi:hypothetical protein AB0F18_37450 [Streptomyces sp. NPDC029216]